MKRTLIIAVLFLGFNVAGFSQAEILVVQSKIKKVIITDKKQISETEQAYLVQDIETGFRYEALPTPAQIAIGEHAEFLIDPDNADMEKVLNPEVLKPKSTFDRIVGIDELEEY
ncbi:MAG: hypothetical protein COC01_04990 [Bacteroidetes bacterium]|nr:hypothetical protein [Bacteroidia bacterium]PCH67854.1 MAG: hypothetical protein COC01_04990 [Bacteroidota bacterium]